MAFFPVSSSSSSAATSTVQTNLIKSNHFNCPNQSHQEQPAFLLTPITIMARPKALQEIMARQHQRFQLLLQMQQAHPMHLAPVLRKRMKLAKKRAKQSFKDKKRHGLKHPDKDARKLEVIAAYYTRMQSRSPEASPEAPQPSGIRLNLTKGRKCADAPESKPTSFRLKLRNSKPSVQKEEPKQPDAASPERSGIILRLRRPKIILRLGKPKSPLSKPPLSEPQ